MTRAEPSLILGVDGGNTKTVAVVATAEGAAVGGGRAGCSDIYNAESEETALGAIRGAVNDALAEAGAASSDLLVGAFSLAGADWPEDIELLERAVDEFGFGRKTLVVNDAIGGLRAGAPDGVGVGVACGTGIAIGARNPHGKVWYSGHWPVAAGGAELGNRALQAVYEARLDLAPATSLTDAILDYFAVEAVDDVLYRTTARGTSWSAQDRARLAPILLDQAALGDAVATEIVLQAATRHADAALTAAAAVGLVEVQFRLVLNGGVLRHSSGVLARAIRTRVEDIAPLVETIQDPPEPVVGAVLLGMDLAGIDGDPSLCRRLVETLPTEELFGT